ncbi:MAG: ribosome biogenesis GTP-binding protein YihA/YsxC [Filifactoraceae bacterium]
MIIRDIQMNMSAVKKEQYPDDGFPQIAMVGRSNVGKSSMINTLLNRRNFARISQTPGKTRTINFYKINEEFYLVDLPGYGYAKLSKGEKDSWGNIMEEYFLNAKNLECVFILVDIRHKPKDEDLMMFDFARHHQIPVTIIATKSDKLSRNEQIKSIGTIRKTFGLLDEKVFPLSALKKTGGEQIWNHVEEIFINSGYQIRVDKK